MASAGEVLTMLCPNSEWSIIGDNYNDINWYGKDPIITEDDFKSGFAKVDEWKAQAEAAKAAARQAILDRLGLTADEAALLLGAN